MTAEKRLTILLVAAGSLAMLRSSAGPLPMLPVRFEPNVGQFGPDVRFAGRLPQFVAEFRPGELRLRRSGGRRPLRWVWEGARRADNLEGVELLRVATNYWLGNRPQRWHSAPNYRAVRYRQLYPGVDAVFYANGDRLEYDFHVAPHADPMRIRWRVFGADAVRLTAQGDLEILAGGERILQRRPAAYQQQGERNQPVSCRYRLSGSGRITLEIGPYDRNHPLIIDPVLVYATYLGAGSNDAIVAVKADAQGMIYVAGYTGSADLFATPDSVQTSAAGARDIFVAKLDPSREGPDSLLYFTYLGGSGADTPTAMALDGSGNVYLTGWTQSTDFPLGGNAPQVQRAGDTGQDAFVVKLNPSISGPLGLLFSTYLGGESSDTGYAIDVDSQGNIYVTGVTKSEEFPVTPRPIQKGRWGDQDAFVAWLDPNAPEPASAIRYSSYFGGEFNDEGRAIAVLRPGVVAIAGATFSEQYQVTPNALRPAYQGGGDVFLAVLDMTRPEFEALVYSTYFGGTGNEEPRRLLRDTQGRLILVGFTLSADFPTTPDAFQVQARRAGQIFVAILDPTQDGPAGLVYSTYFGGTGGEVAYDAAMDDAKRIYLTGYTLSADFPVTSQAFQKDYGGGVEAFCSVLDPGKAGPAALLYSTYLGGAGINVGYGIAVTRDGVLYVGGSAQDRTFPITPGALQTTHGGGLADGFVVALKPEETGLGVGAQRINIQSP